MAASRIPGRPKISLTNLAKISEAYVFRAFPHPLDEFIDLALHDDINNDTNVKEFSLFPKINDDSRVEIFSLGTVQRSEVEFSPVSG
jgi:hypothetical protein